MIGSIIKFRHNANQQAAKWCRKHHLSGKVIDEELGRLQIDVGLPYNIYASIDQIQIVSENGEFEPLSSDLLNSAPIPDSEY